MKFKQVEIAVKGVPFISGENSKKLYDFIIKNKFKNILELGIAHGTASCFIAAAIDEIGEGKLTCVDLIDVQDVFKPSIEEQLSKLNLNKYVEIHRMKSGYNWFLHDDITECSKNNNKICIPKYDLIIIDGPKNWTIDSSSFFLADKLLKENGWVIWDDYKWTYKNVDSKRDVTDGISHRTLSDDELKIPHIQEIFNLLVMQHPNYGNFIIQKEGDWAWAQKIKQDIKSIKYTTSATVSSMLFDVLQRIMKRLKK